MNGDKVFEKGERQAQKRDRKRQDCFVVVLGVRKLALEKIGSCFRQELPLLGAKVGFCQFVDQGKAL